MLTRQALGEQIEYVIEINYLVVSSSIQFSSVLEECKFGPERAQFFTMQYMVRSTGGYIVISIIVYVKVGIEEFVEIVPGEVINNFVFLY